MISQYLSVTSEIKELEEIIASISPEDVIDKMSFEARLKTAKELLVTLPKNREIPAARLTFRGRPVFGTHGMLAEFSSKSLETFSDAFTAVLAGLTTDNLRDSGPILDKDKNQLRLIGTAIGSFGFELELPQQQQFDFFSETDPSEDAMKKIEILFRLSAEGSDDEIAEIIADIPSRAVKNVYQFLYTLVQNEAWCGLEFGDSYFRYSDYEQLKYAADRLKNENIRETNESHYGMFQGVLPEGRTFEFKLVDQEEVIHGKIDNSIGEPDIINRELLYKSITAKFRVMQVGQGKPRYTLLSLNGLKGNEN